MADAASGTGSRRSPDAVGAKADFGAGTVPLPATSTSDAAQIAHATGTVAASAVGGAERLPATACTYARPDGG